jgi:hypothetical protein
MYVSPCMSICNRRHTFNCMCHLHLCVTRHHRPCLHRSSDSRGSDIIDPTSAAAMNRGAPASSILPPPQQQLEGALASSIPPLPQQQLEGLQHHQPRLRRSNVSRGSSIIDLISATTTTRGAPASLTPPPLQNGLRGSGIIDPTLSRNTDSRGSDIIDLTSAIATARGAPVLSTPPPCNTLCY